MSSRCWKTTRTGPSAWRWSSCATRRGARHDPRTSPVLRPPPPRPGALGARGLPGQPPDARHRHGVPRGGRGAAPPPGRPRPRPRPRHRMEMTMHAEAMPTDWLQLAEEMRLLSEDPDISETRREMYQRAAMEY